LRASLYTLRTRKYVALSAVHTPLEEQSLGNNYTTGSGQENSAYLLHIYIIAYNNVE